MNMQVFAAVVVRAGQQEGSEERGGEGKRGRQGKGGGEGEEGGGVSGQCHVMLFMSCCKVLR